VGEEININGFTQLSTNNPWNEKTTPAEITKRGIATEQDFFDGIEFENVEVGGTRLRSPVRYYDHTMLVAGFGAPTPNVQKALPSDRLKPVELASGTAAVALVAWEYV